MLLHDRFDGGQTQAAAARFCRKASLKYPFSNACREFRYRCLQSRFSRTARREARTTTGIRLIHILCAHQKFASLRSSFTGINHHVLDDLRKLNRITNDWIQIPLKGKVGFELRSAEGKKDGVGENFRNVERLFNRGSAF